MTVTPPSSDALLDRLEQERTRFLAEVARVPLPLHTERLVAEGWTVVEVVEHVTRVDRGVGRLLEAGRAGQLRAAAAPDVTAAPLPATVVAKLRDRSIRIEAPERVRPTGLLTSEAALDALAQARAALVEAYRATAPDVLDGAAHPHPFFGPLTLRAWLEMSAHHDARHAQQVAELAAAAAAAAAGDAAADGASRLPG